jgi:uncharacterized membrane protein
MHQGWLNMGWMGILWWVLIAVAIVAVVLALRRGSTGATSSPEEELKRRYARGEIDHEQYQRMLEDLRR